MTLGWPFDAGAASSTPCFPKRSCSRADAPPALPSCSVWDAKGGTFAATVICTELYIGAAFSGMMLGCKRQAFCVDKVEASTLGQVGGSMCRRSCLRCKQELNSNRLGMYGGSSLNGC